MEVKTGYVEQKMERNHFQISYCPTLHIQFILPNPK